MEQLTISLCIFKLAVILLSICHCIYWCNGCVEEERIALLQIKDSIHYPFRSSLDLDWVGEDCCRWSGIYCNRSSSRVVEIYLSRIRDSGSGTWNPNATLFTQFKELNSLSLEGNNIGGWVMPQAFSEMERLQYLDLGYNNLNEKIDSLWGLCGLRALQLLDLGWNKLNSLPMCLGNLFLLEALFLNDNNFTTGLFGNSMQGLCGLRALRSLNLDSNNLNSIPMCLDNLFLLEDLSLSGNNFIAGSFGNSIQGLCGLRALRSLNLNSNNLNSIPKCFGNLSLLEDLHLSENNLTGDSFGNATQGLCGMRALQRLDLYSNKLNSIPMCLDNLSLLEELDLSKNNLIGGLFGNSIQGLCGIRALRRLNLDSNKLNSIPMCLGNLSLLEELYLSNNSLTGGLFGNSIQGLKRLDRLSLYSNDLIDESISPWISNLTSLTDLDLMDNHLKDSNTMKDICRLRTLNNLYLSMNSIVGNIQPCLGDMHNITSLLLSENQFSGSIPFSMFANLSKLSFIDLSYNNELEVETESPSWIPTFQLQSLYLQNCVINKDSGGNIPTFISTQWDLQYLDLTHTFLKGTIPSWLLYNVTTYRSIVIRDNFLEGPFPLFAQYNSSWVFALDISNNKIRDMVPPTIGVLLPNLVHLNMSTNELQGNIPSSLSKLKQLQTLDLSKNMLSGDMPHTLTNDSFLKYLSLSNNGLSGEIMSRDSKMTRLLVLVLDGNNFTGSIPTSLLNSPSLIILDVRGNKLSGPIPSWLYSLMNLTSLFLGENFFEGHIPTKLCQMQNLHMLDISYNNISGRIPSCLNNITSWKEGIPIQIDNIIYDSYPNLTVGFNSRVATDFTIKGTKRTYEGLPLKFMTGIDLSMNHLTGDIPFQIGDLEELHSLNLSNNFLSGPIPNTFQNLANIESLDLSHNILVGTIPPQIIQLYLLSTFSVAFNNLSGIIPYEKQFQTFNDSSYMGNPGLCGPPLQRNCSSNILPPSQDKNVAQGDYGILYSPMFFYLWIAFSFAIGFWGFIALVLFKKNFRWKLFRFVDRYYDSMVM